MALKDDLEQAFKDNLETGGKIPDIAQAIVDIYEQAVKDGEDSIGNTWSNVQFSLVKNAIVAQFNLSFNTSSYLQFTLIEASLVDAWAGALMKSKKPHPSQSVVKLGNVIMSTSVGIPPLFSDSDGYDNIVNAFYDIFTKHAKTLKFLYTGIAKGGSPPPTILVPVTSFTIK